MASNRSPIPAERYVLRLLKSVLLEKLNEYGPAVLEIHRAVSLRVRSALKPCLEQRKELLDVLLDATSKFILPVISDVGSSFKSMFDESGTKIQAMIADKGASFDKSMLEVLLLLIRSWNSGGMN